MKIKDNLKLREIAGESIVLLQGENGSDMTKVLALNPSSRFLWEELKGKDFSIDDVVNLLCSHYDVDDDRAREDAGKWLDQLADLNVTE